MLCFRARRSPLTLLLYAQMYKWVPVNLMLGVALYGPVSHVGVGVGGVETLVVASCYGNGT